MKLRTQIGILSVVLGLMLYIIPAPTVLAEKTSSNDIGSTDSISDFTVIETTGITGANEKSLLLEEKDITSTLIKKLEKKYHYVEKN